VKLTKFEHACFTVEKDGNSIVVDPGGLTTDYIEPEKVVAIIITHSHGDHFSPEHIDDILEDNPGAVVMGPKDITDQLKSRETRTIKPGDNFIHEGIELEFFGGTHATIHPDLSTPENVGVMIDERVYYPGDSFVVPDKSVDVLALPISAPWLKIQESIDFMLAVAPADAFPTHDGILSAAGQQVADNNIKSFAEEAAIDYRRIDGTTIDIE
jgi:L-ascorbate metabolism protein UlaG (beta-lactamase superfamily)